MANSTQSKLPEERSFDFDKAANFFPRQDEALAATENNKFVLYGGSVGSGKSRWLRWALLYWLIIWSQELKLSGIRVGLFCEDYPALNDRHLSKIKEEFPEGLGSYNEQRHEFTLKPKWGGGVIAFRNLDDPQRYLSVEFAAMAVDEINRNPKSTFDMLRSRLRWPGIEHTKFMAACNPIGEPWVKNMWVKHRFPAEEQEVSQFCFINALPTDNPHLPQSYFESLKSLPDAERKAYLEGDWDSFDTYMDEQGFIRLLTDAELLNAITDGVVHAGEKIAGSDPGAGGDESAIVMRSETAAEIQFNQKLPDTMQFVQPTIRVLNSWNSTVVAVDVTGVGKGYADRLKELRIQVTPVNFGERARNPRFANRKAELYWKLREWILSGGKLKRDPLWSQLDVIKYKVNSGGKIEIEGKDSLRSKGIPSPNIAEALVLSFAVSLHAVSFNESYAARPQTDKFVSIWRNE